MGNTRFRETESSAVTVTLVEQMFDLVRLHTLCTSPYYAASEGSSAAAKRSD